VLDASLCRPWHKGHRNLNSLVGDDEDAGVDEWRTATIAEGKIGSVGAQPQVHGEHPLGGGIACRQEVMRAFWHQQCGATEMGHAAADRMHRDSIVGLAGDDVHATDPGDATMARTLSAGDKVGAVAANVNCASQVEDDEAIPNTRARSACLV
jgi:hypothetical protein